MPENQPQNCARQGNLNKVCWQSHYHNYSQNHAMLAPHKLVWHVMMLLYKPHLALMLLFPSVQGPKMCFAEQRLLSDISEAVIAAQATSWVGPIGICEGREPIWERSGHCPKKILNFREKGVLHVRKLSPLKLNMKMTSEDDVLPSVWLAGQY